jgi:hypothetical protein
MQLQSFRVSIMRALHDKGDVFSNKTYHKNVMLQLTLHNFCIPSSGYVLIIFDRLIHRPVDYFYFTGPSLCSVIVFVRSLDLSVALASSSVDLTAASSLLASYR